MKKLLLTTALTLGAVAAAHAGPIIHVTGYSTPDAWGFNTITTTASGAPDTPYSYYTGPIIFNVAGGANLTVYCVDLNHWLQTGYYEVVPLTKNGEGQPISAVDANRIGEIAFIGAVNLGFGVVNDKVAAAAQAAIWDIGYAPDGATSVTGDGFIASEIAALLAIPNGRTPLALVPWGTGWPESPYASQEMVIGLGSPVPEASTWAMGLMGFGLTALFGLYKTRNRVTA
jgi:hypothetical protein